MENSEYKEKAAIGAYCSQPFDECMKCENPEFVITDCDIDSGGICVNCAERFLVVRYNNVVVGTRQLSQESFDKLMRGVQNYKDSKISKKEWRPSIWQRIWGKIKCFLIK